eukprot:SAG11_NODE_6604_length_1280_cov_3.090601_1_plen_209_part_00
MIIRLGVFVIFRSILFYSPKYARVRAFVPAAGISIRPTPHHPTPTPKQWHPIEIPSESHPIEIPYGIPCIDETAEFLTPIALITAAKAMNDGKKLVASDSLRAHRMNIAKLAVYYPMLLRWEEMQSFAKNESLPWPIEQTKKAALEWFLDFGSTLKPQPLTSLNEGGTHDLAWFKKTVMNETRTDPAEDPDRFLWDQASTATRWSPIQ